MTPTPRQISEKVEELKALLIPKNTADIKDLLHDNRQMQELRAILTKHNGNTKIDELKTSDDENILFYELGIKNTNTRIIAKHFIQLYKRDKASREEVERLWEIEKKYNYIMDSIKEN
tara:strand:+ start:281 stop:634 length:354 start_codon:yes stop_codon:yes gene_type:complete